MLETLNASHLGVVKMKGTANSYVCWPSIDKEITKRHQIMQWMFKNSEYSNQGTITSYE